MGIATVGAPRFSGKAEAAFYRLGSKLDNLYFPHYNSERSRYSVSYA